MGPEIPESLLTGTPLTACCQWRSEWAGTAGGPKGGYRYTPEHGRHSSDRSADRGGARRAGRGLAGVGPGPTDRAGGRGRGRAGPGEDGGRARGDAARCRGAAGGRRGGG